MTDFYYSTIIISGLLILNFGIRIEDYLNETKQRKFDLLELCGFFIFVQIVLMMFEGVVLYRDAWFINITIFVTMLSFIEKKYAIIYFLITSFLLFFLDNIDSNNRFYWYALFILMYLLTLSLDTLCNFFKKTET